MKNSFSRDEDIPYVAIHVTLPHELARTLSKSGKG
jgi:hypothetical protein